MVYLVDQVAVQVPHRQSFALGLRHCRLPLGLVGHTARLEEAVVFAERLRFVTEGLFLLAFVVVVIVVVIPFVVLVPFSVTVAPDLVIDRAILILFDILIFVVRIHREFFT